MTPSPGSPHAPSLPATTAAPNALPANAPTSTRATGTHMTGTPMTGTPMTGTAPTGRRIRRGGDTARRTAR
ncbi:hypothetical protein [Streptomyces sp. NPDC014733]|uniref:hypothetical protein n=1 Tax=Streptomyces sp. NPDC014733 TaxID=3364885 RepID=UPI0037012C0A